MRRILGVLAVLLVLAPASAAPAAPVTGGGGGTCGARYFYLHTLKVEAEPRKKTYRRGEIVKIDFLVTRPGENDPVKGEVPLPQQIPRQPAEGVTAEASFWAGNFYVFGGEVTDEEGRATVSLRTHPDMPAGPVDLAVSARKYYNRGGCPDGEEDGYNDYPKAFKLV